MAENSEFVVGFPPPPPYYSSFISENCFEPPFVSSNDVHPYGGSLPDHKNLLHSTEHTRNYKDDMKNSLDKLLNEALEFASDRKSNQQIDKNVIPLHAAINNMYQLINEYRAHEARDNLCRQMIKQIEELKTLENELTRAHENASNILMQTKLTEENISS